MRRVTESIWAIRAPEITDKQLVLQPYRQINRDGYFVTAGTSDLTRSTIQLAAEVVDCEPEQIGSFKFLTQRPQKVNHNPIVFGMSSLLVTLVNQGGAWEKVPVARYDYDVGRLYESAVQSLDYRDQLYHDAQETIAAFPGHFQPCCVGEVVRKCCFEQQQILHDLDAHMKVIHLLSGK